MALRNSKVQDQKRSTKFLLKHFAEIGKEKLFLND